MRLNRRDFLSAASVAALIATKPVLAAPAPLVAMAASNNAIPSLRSTLNIGLISGGGNEYRFIDHFLIAEQFGPSGSSWSTGAVWSQSIAADGYPKVSLTAADNRTFGGGVRIPASFQYGEVGSGQFYVLRWKGNADVRLMLQSGSWTYQASKSTNATQVSSDRWKTTSGSDSYIVLSFTGPAQLFPLIVFATDPGKTGARLSKLQFYRLEDEADLLAGKIFRAPYKRSIVDLCPSAIRFMDWVGGNNSKLARFESRTLPGYATFTGNSNWVASPLYGDTVGINQYTLGSAAGMPAAPLHGEVVTCRIGAGMARTGAKTITTISNSKPGRVTAPSHGFASGDVIVHQLATGVMPKLNLLPCTITVIDTDNYSLGVDTTTFGSFSGSAKATQFITLNVGGRGAYPVTFPIPTSFASAYSNAYMATGDYKTFIFDKTVAARTDGAGNYIYGTWLFNDTGATNGHAGGVPLEICVALINELNAMQPARPISMWTNIPCMGLCSMDPDYSTQSSWGIQAVATIINGQNGFPGLVSSSQLLIEYSNETWNSGGTAFSQTYYLAYKGFLRWPASGTTDYASMAALRSVINVEDIKSSTSNNSRLRFVLSGQGTLGVSGLNQVRIDGSSYFLRDTLNVWGAGVAPMTHHDYFAFAGYFAPSTAFDTAYLAALTTSWTAASANPAAQEAICAAYVNGVVNPTLGGSETVDRYRLTLLPAYVAKMKSYGKSVIMYEGGWDHNIQPVSAGASVTGTLPFAAGTIQAQSNMITNVASSYAAAITPGCFVIGYGIPSMTTVVASTGTSVTLSKNATASLSTAQFIAFPPQQMFLLACKRSQSWATAILTYFNQFGPGSGMPADYVQSDIRWGNTAPSAYGVGNSEWGGLDLLWQQKAVRNKALI